MIPLGHIRTNSAVYSKINYKVEICSAIRYRFSIANTVCFKNPKLNPYNHYSLGTVVFITLLTTITVYVVTIYCAQ